MALSNLKGIPKKPPYDDADVERVKGLLNSGAVDVGEVAQYFKVPKTVVVGNLLGIPADAYTSGKATPEQAKAVERLVKKGVANTSEVAQYFSAPQSVVEQSLKSDFLYNDAQIAEAQQGLPVSAPTQVQIDQIPADGDYTEAETQLVQDAIEGGTTSAADAAKYFGVTENQINNEIARRNQFQAGQQVTIDDPYPGGVISAPGLNGVNTSGTVGGNNIPGGAAAGGAAAAGAAAGAAGGASAAVPAGGAAAGGAAAGGAVPAAAPAGGAAVDPNALSLSGKANAVVGVPAATTTGASIPTGLKGSELALKTGALGSIDMLDKVNQAARSDINPYAVAGIDALKTQRALSGLDGQDAFDAAYQASPQMAFLREQGEQAALRNAAATGGLGGGNVLKELTRYNTGLASQDLQNQIANINQLTGRGFNAATQQAGLNINTGLPAASAINTLGLNLATGRTDVGNKLADQYANAASKLATILGTQGTNLSNMIGSTGANINNMRNNAAINEASAQEAFGGNLSNIQTGIGNQLAGVPMAPIATPNYTAGVANAANAAALGAEIFAPPDLTPNADPTPAANPAIAANANAGAWGSYYGVPPQNSAWSGYNPPVTQYDNSWRYRG